MKNKLILLLIFLFSCDWPETTVTNEVHRDGSVTRTVIMKTNSRPVSPADYRVPVDSSWSFSDTFELRDSDTIFVIKASRNFESVEELNKGYQNDTGSNRHLERTVKLRKKFRWFYSYYELSENIAGLMKSGVRPEEYLNGDDLRLFYHPELISDSMLNSKDSLIHKEHKARADSLEEDFIFNALFEEWISGYLDLSGDSSVLSRRDDLIKEFRKNDLEKDSMFINIFGGEYSAEHSTDIDSSFTFFEKNLNNVISTKSYTCEAVMPGKITSTNGLITEDGLLRWNVDWKYFLTSDYSMFVNSRVSNTWAWVVTVLAIAVLLRVIKRRKIKGA